MTKALRRPDRAGTAWRWPHVLLVVAAVLGTIALVANLVGA